MAKRDYYEVLGVSRTASADEIKKAHRKLVRQHHPDANKGNPKSEEKFKEAQEAYDVLSDAQKRTNYDQFGHAGVGMNAGGGAGVDPFEAFRRAQQAGRGRRPRQTGPGVSVEDFEAGGAGGFTDMFEQLFGQARGSAGARGGPHSRRAEPPPPEDLVHPITLSFEQAARGTTLPLQISRDGKIETIDIKIPAGVKDGSRIRIKGRGHQVDGQSGDLYIVTQVTPHPHFRRDEMDILVDLPISLYEAVLGAKVEAPTLEGPVTLTIPPGTSSGAKLRIRGRGIDRAGQKGDQFVVVKVIVPKSLSEEDRKLVEELAKRNPVSARG